LSCGVPHGPTVATRYFLLVVPALGCFGIGKGLAIVDANLSLPSCRCPSLSGKLVYNPTTPTPCCSTHTAKSRDRCDQDATNLAIGTGRTSQARDTRAPHPTPFSPTPQTFDRIYPPSASGSSSTPPESSTPHDLSTHAFPTRTAARRLSTIPPLTPAGRSPHDSSTQLGRFSAPQTAPP